VEAISRAAHPVDRHHTPSPRRTRGHVNAVRSAGGLAPAGDFASSDSSDTPDARLVRVAV